MSRKRLGENANFWDKILKKFWLYKNILYICIIFIATCCSTTIITNSPMKHRKKPGAMPCHRATKASVMKWEMSLFPRNRSLLYRYLREKRISLAEVMAIPSFFLPSSTFPLELTDLHGLLQTNDRLSPKGTHICFCARQEKPAILISRLLLRMRRTYVASIRLDFY